MGEYHQQTQVELVFTTLAWLKLQYMCHKADTEVCGFGISDEKNFLKIIDFMTVKQQSTTASVDPDPNSMADLAADYAQKGVHISRVLRVWIHTHPKMSANPSGTDESTFREQFGSCDWAVMAIVSKTNDKYARLRIGQTTHGIFVSKELPVSIDWEDWNKVSEDIISGKINMQELIKSWEEELKKNVSKPVYNNYTVIGGSGVGGPYNPQGSGTTYFPRRRNNYHGSGGYSPYDDDAPSGNRHPYYGGTGLSHTSQNHHIDYRNRDENYNHGPREPNNSSNVNVVSDDFLLYEEYTRQLDRDESKQISHKTNGLIADLIKEHSERRRRRKKRKNNSGVYYPAHEIKVSHRTENQRLGVNNGEVQKTGFTNNQESNSETGGFADSSKPDNNSSAEAVTSANTTGLAAEPITKSTK